MGKSSLRVQITKRLQAEGFACAAIDLTAIGSQNITIEQWYAGLIYSLVNYFNLAKKSSDKFNFRQWWRNLDFLSPVQRFDEFISQVLLKEVSQKIVIFIDEIDTTLSLNFSMDDFFALIRAFYNHRGNNPEYKRLSFVLLGVASPSNLIQDKNLTPFNLGKAIILEGFQLHDTEPLAKGLTPKYSDSQTILKAILTWTNGQPFLTQKICYLISRSQNPILEGKEIEFVDKIVKNKIIENWDSQDNPEHLTTIRNRLLKSQLNVNRLLEMYRQILIKGDILADNSPEQIELLLTGLIYKQQDKLKIYNYIYREIFNLDWVEKLINL